MARKRISEYKAKSLLLESLGLPYFGKTLSSSEGIPSDLFSDDSTYVVKVDEGIKKRFKQGLVKLNVPSQEIPGILNEFQKKGYSRFLVEKYKEHDFQTERYLSFEVQRYGIDILVSHEGGVNIEENQDSVHRFQFPQDSVENVAEYIGVNSEFISQIIDVMNLFHISFLEINPLVVDKGELSLLDLAVEVDSAGEFFVNNSWTGNDFVGEMGGTTEEEKAIDTLSAKSQASFKLNVLNPHGSLFMLLSGGGASIVLADEVYNQGKGKDLANYGEYSGNPNAEETYLYTKQILQLLLKSQAEKKVLIIAGGVANFTDIRVTFKGIIQAIDEVKVDLQREHVKVFVRRGGPYQEEGLSQMRQYLEKEQLLGMVSGPEMVLTDIVNKALESIA